MRQSSILGQAIPGPNDFGLSGTSGDDVWLTILDTGGQICLVRRRRPFRSRGSG